MRIVRFLPAGLAAVTDFVTAAMVRRNQKDYPGRFIVFRIVMFGETRSTERGTAGAAGFPGLTITGFWTRTNAICVGA
jgi:hypothetical protein